MNNNYKIKDSLKIVSMENCNENENHNPIKGHVIIKDEKGNVVVDKDNLVVRNGRILLCNLFCSFISNGYVSGMTNSQAHTTNDNNTTFKATVNDETLKIPTTGKTVNGFFLRYGGNTNIPTASDDSITNPYSVDDADSNRVDPSEINYNQSNLSFKLTFNITGSNELAATMNELGLFVKYETGSSPSEEEMMISRIVFDTLSINSSTAYTMEYYLYF